ncbi:MAG: O-methyltransferase, partial [Ferruginibacter sp.]|nr:O-methyltransferase [Ferruginibacter sp.]
HMLSGHVQGQFLQMMSCMVNPSRILEIGTFTGFSALCLSKGLKKDGKLHTIEIRKEDASVAQGFFNKSSCQSQIFLHVGNARDIIPQIDETWDMVFIDADKVSYIEYYELTLPRVKSGGWIIADNVLFHGEVLNESIKGKNAVAISLFNSHIAADQRVEQVLLTIRDGLSLIRKL